MAWPGLFVSAAQVSRGSNTYLFGDRQLLQQHWLHVTFRATLIDFEHRAYSTAAKASRWITYAR